MQTRLSVFLITLWLLFTQPILCQAQFGALDPGFIPVSTNLSVTCTAVQTDGKVIIAGNFTTAGGVTRNRLARLHTNGTLDTGFDPAGGPSSQAVDLLIQPDGKILIAGNFGLYNGFAIKQVARVHTDGSRDTTFKTGTGANLPVLSLALQPDGKILLGGNFTNFNGIACKGLVRLLANGTVDASFSTGSGLSGYAEDIALYPDGRIMVVGEFTAYQSSPRKNMVRLLPNGNIDPTFDPGTGPNAVVTTCLLQPDGKVFISGNFTSVSGTSMNRLGRLNADGSVDPDFNTGTGVPNAPYESLLLSNGKIVIAGGFASINSLPIHNIACLNPNGSVDMGFNAGGYGALAVATDVDLANDGKIVLGGLFTQYNGNSRIHVARLFADPTTATEEVLASPGFQVFPNPCSDRLSVQLPASTLHTHGSYSILSADGRRVYFEKATQMVTEIAVGHLPSGLYIIRFTNGATVLDQKWMKE